MHLTGISGILQYAWKCLDCAFVRAEGALPNPPPASPVSRRLSSWGGVSAAKGGGLAMGEAAAFEVPADARVFGQLVLVESSATGS